MHVVSNIYILIIVITTAKYQLVEPCYMQDSNPLGPTRICGNLYRKWITLYDGKIGIGNVIAI
jgi:hypothetical protein